MSTNRANLLTILGGMILACVYASITTPAHGLLPWTGPDGRVVIQEPRVGETWRLTDRGWVRVEPERYGPWGKPRVLENGDIILGPHHPMDTYAGEPGSPLGSVDYQGPAAPVESGTYWSAPR